MGEQGRGGEGRGEKEEKNRQKKNWQKKKLAKEVAKEDGVELVWLVWWKFLNACLFLTLILAPWR